MADTATPAKTETRGLGAFNSMEVVGGVWVAYGAVGWFIALGGLAAVTNLCGGDSTGCFINTGLYWFALIVEFALIILTLVALMRGSWFRQILVPFYAIFATVLMFATQDVLSSGHDSSSNKVKSRNRAAAAGFILLIIYDLVAIVVLLADGQMRPTGTTTGLPTPAPGPHHPHPPPSRSPPTGPASGDPYGHNPYGGPDPYGGASYPYASRDHGPPPA